MTFSKRLHDALDDIEAELDVLSDEDNLEASAAQFESLFLAEERLRHARKRLHRILGRKDVGPVIGGRSRRKTTPWSSWSSPRPGDVGTRPRSSAGAS